MSDTGGFLPGGYGPGAYDIIAEGLNIPPLKILQKGVLKHFSEIREIHEAYYAKKNLIEEKLGKYRLYKSSFLSKLGF